MFCEILKGLHFFQMLFIYHRRLSEVMSELQELEELRERSSKAEHRVKVSCICQTCMSQIHVGTLW